MMDYWIAVVDDEPISLTNARSILSGEGMKVSCLRSGGDLLKFVEKNEPDLILLDIMMPEMDGFETYHALRQYEYKTGSVYTPVIFLTGEKNSETERRGLKAGASDFIHKPFDRDILVKRIINAVKNNRMIESLTEEASFDKLTGFLNKASGTKKISDLCVNRIGALMIFDLDSFKLVNDIFGHDMGDRILVSFADILRSSTRNGDVMSRIGGDEFMGFFMDVTGEDAVSPLANRLNKELTDEACSLMGADHGIPLGVSIGVALAPKHSSDYQTLFRYADNSLYKVKQNNKHGFEIYDPGAVSGDPEEDLKNEIERITRIAEERNDVSGAQLLGQDAFTSNYRYLIRLNSRYGGGVNRVLFSLIIEEQGERFMETVSEFSAILQKNLRKSDLLYQSKPGHFLAVLPRLSEEETGEVIKRVLDIWEKTDFGQKTEVKYFMSMIPE